MRGGRVSLRATHPAALLILAVALVLGFLVETSAEAKNGGAKTTATDCRAGSQVRLRVVPGEASTLAVSAVVFSKDQDTWRWTLRHDKEVSAKGKAVAKSTRRSFKVRRVMADLPGSDLIGFRARNTTTGEVCRVSLTY